MNEHYFLFGLAFVWTVFAVIQDYRTREVSNWLNFSLIAFVLGYRAFYATVTGEWMFLVYGVIGVGGFIGLAYVFYYTRIFAGGDAKLLMGYGGVLPYASFSGMLTLFFFFFMTFFSVGVLYTLVYSMAIAIIHRRQFLHEMKKQMVKSRLFLGTSLAVGIVSELLLYFFVPVLGIGYALGFFIILPMLFVYARALEQAVMVREVSAKTLTEGDWLEHPVRVAGKTIRPSVHGLSFEDIALLQKYKKRVVIKDGVPFTPTFLITLVCLFFAWVSGILGNFTL